MKPFIFGKVDVNDQAVVTHRDSYLLENLTVVSVRRPFLGPGLLTGSAFTLFGLGFSDLLYAGELLMLGMVITASIVLGTKLGQLQLLSRDLKNTELSGAVWGAHGALQDIRSEIVTVLRDLQDRKLESTS